jgi:hypothetical protein
VLVGANKIGEVTGGTGSVESEDYANYKFVYQAIIVINKLREQQSPLIRGQRAAEQEDSWEGARLFRPAGNDGSEGNCRSERPTHP